ncbi:MAG: hypothetical protein ACOX69_10510 [Coriobacteriales bacterium]|jgi:Fe-S-cluster-containing dehydrogenase component
MTIGILVNTEYCTGCHSCEVACRNHLGLKEGEFGIKLTETGPYKYEDGKAKNKWEWQFQPVLTKACTLCTDRTEMGKMPMCVQHCQAWCLDYGEVEDLVKKIEPESTWALLTPAQG